MQASPAAAKSAAARQKRALDLTKSTAKLKPKVPNAYVLCALGRMSYAVKACEV